MLNDLFHDSCTFEYETNPRGGGQRCFLMRAAMRPQRATMRPPGYFEYEKSFNKTLSVGAYPLLFASPSLYRLLFLLLLFLIPLLLLLFLIRLLLLLLLLLLFLLLLSITGRNKPSDPRRHHPLPLSRCFSRFSRFSRFFRRQTFSWLIYRVRF